MARDVLARPSTAQSRLGSAVVDVSSLARVRDCEFASQLASRRLRQTNDRTRQYSALLDSTNVMDIRPCGYSVTASRLSLILK